MLKGIGFSFCVCMCRARVCVYDPLLLLMSVSEISYHIRFGNATRHSEQEQQQKKRVIQMQFRCCWG